MPTTSAALFMLPKVAMAQSLTAGGAESIATSATDSTRDGTGAPSRPATSSEAPSAAKTASTPAPASRKRMHGT